MKKSEIQTDIKKIKIKMKDLKNQRLECDRELRKLRQQYILCYRMIELNDKK